MRAFIVLTVVLLTACGGGGGSSAKGVFDKWNDSGKLLDLTGDSFNTLEPTYWVFLSGAICSSSMIFVGDNSSGTWIISNGIVYSGTDPGCAQLDGSGTYTNDGTTMTVCRTVPSNSCSSWN